VIRAEKKRGNVSGSQGKKPSPVAENCETKHFNFTQWSGSSGLWMRTGRGGLGLVHEGSSYIRGARGPPRPVGRKNAKEEMCFLGLAHRGRRVKGGLQAMLGKPVPRPGRALPKIRQNFGRRNRGHGGTGRAKTPIP